MEAKSNTMNSDAMKSVEEIPSMEKGKRAKAINVTHMPARNGNKKPPGFKAPVKSVSPKKSVSPGAEFFSFKIAIDIVSHLVETCDPELPELKKELVKVLEVLKKIQTDDYVFNILKGEFEEDLVVKCTKETIKNLAPTDNLKMK